MTNMNKDINILYFRNKLLTESEEKPLSDKQKKIAKLDPPKDELDAGDFEKLRSMKKEANVNDPKLPGGSAIHKLLDKVAEDWGKDSDLYGTLEDTIVGYADNYGGITRMGKAEIKSILSNFDVLDDYLDILDPKQGASIKEEQGELKLGIKYDLDGDSGFISTGGSPNPEDWKFLADKGKYPYLSVKNKLVPSSEQPTKYGKAFNLGMGKGHHIDETEDHEVSMAHNSLESIIKHAMDLKSKLGSEEKDIPAWIQDHITNAANFISQAAENYHEYGSEDETEEVEDLYEAKKKPKKWIDKAIHPSKEGSLRKALGVKKGETIPAGKLAAAAKKGGKLGQRARLAQTLKKLD